jgi:hypothetical protein
MISLAPPTFELWAPDHGYDIAPIVVPAVNRTYADRDTQLHSRLGTEGRLVSPGYSPRARWIRRR